MKSALNLIWIDLEMTGLSPENDRIIEIATVVTDKDLNVLGEGPVYAISQPQERLDGMDEWNTRQHGKSGLTERVKASSITEAHAELKTIEFLSQFIDPRQSPMCGNSICQDRRFLFKSMPNLEKFFHYRNLDVSSFKEVFKNIFVFTPGISKGYWKAKNIPLCALSSVSSSNKSFSSKRTSPETS